MRPQESSSPECCVFMGTKQVLVCMLFSGPVVPGGYPKRLVAEQSWFTLGRLLRQEVTMGHSFQFPLLQHSRVWGVTEKSECPFAQCTDPQERGLVAC